MEIPANPPVPAAAALPANPAPPAGVAASGHALAGGVVAGGAVLAGASSGATLLGSVGQVPAAPGASPAASPAAPPAAAPAAPLGDHADIRPLDIPAAMQILLAEVRAELDLPLALLKAAGAIELGSRGHPDGRPNFPGGLGANLSSLGGLKPAVIETPLQAAHALVEMILRSIPDESLLPPDHAAPEDDAPPAPRLDPLVEAVPSVAPGAPGVLHAALTPDAAAWSAALDRAQTALDSGLQRATDAVAAWRDVSPAVLDATRDARALVAAVLSDELPNPLWLRPEWLGLAPRLERLRRRALRRRWIDPDYAQAPREDVDGRS